MSLDRPFRLSSYRDFPLIRLDRPLTESSVFHKPPVILTPLLLLGITDSTWLSGSTNNIYRLKTFGGQTSKAIDMALELMESYALSVSSYSLGRYL